jgi:hypothetical protein
MPLSNTAEAVKKRNARIIQQTILSQDRVFKRRAPVGILGGQW